MPSVKLGIGCHANEGKRSHGPWRLKHWIPIQSVRWVWRRTEAVAGDVSQLHHAGLLFTITEDGRYILKFCQSTIRIDLYNMWANSSSRLIMPVVTQDSEAQWTVKSDKETRIIGKASVGLAHFFFFLYGKPQSSCEYFWKRIYIWINEIIGKKEEGEKKEVIFTDFDHCTMSSRNIKKG